MRLFASKSENSTEPTVTYGFSSFANVVQTLKDSASKILEKGPVWDDIDQLRYGSFLHHSRNAATHDGNPVISAWADGRYYVPSSIKRKDNRNKWVTIPAPDVDVRTFCLEFAYDYSHYLSDALVPALNNPVYQGALYTFDELEAIFRDFKHMPDFARADFEIQKEIISYALAKITNDPIAEARQGLDQLAEYCKKKEKEN